MRRLLMAIMVLLPVEAVAHDQAPRHGEERGGYFGAPVVKWTVLRDQGAGMFGGYGGWYVTPSLMIGGGAYGTMTEVDAPTAAVADAPGPLDVKLESFGVDLEFANRPAAPTHMTLGARIGGAAIHYVRNRTSEQHGETDFALLLEPSVGVERRVSEWLHLHFAVSYRLVNGAEQPGLDNKDLMGPAAALSVRLGRF